MTKDTLLKKLPTQISIFEDYETPPHEEIMEYYDYAKDLEECVLPKGDTFFGFWVQTLADLEFLDLELRKLTEEYTINPLDRVVNFKGDEEFIRLRISHLEKVRGRITLYADLVNKFGDTNAYAFHNLYPYKGKFYPRLVRTLVNAFGLNENSLLLDPFNGSGTTTHEASLMGIKSIGIDVTPMGTIISEVKNNLLFVKESDLDFTPEELEDILDAIRKRNWKHENPTVYKLILVIYFDTIDALKRTSRYNRKGELGLFIEKLNYVKNCYKKTMEIKEKYGIRFESAHIMQGDVLELRNIPEFREKFDACITSPPYYFSIDYVGKDKVAYEYLNVDMKKIESKYLGMRDGIYPRGNYKELPARIALYYEDLKQSINNIFWALKPSGKLAIVVGDSTVNGKKLPTTLMTKKFCEEVGFKLEKLIFNPLLGARNRAIRGESVIICQKPK